MGLLYASHETEPRLLEAKILKGFHAAHDTSSMQLTEQQSPDGLLNAPNETEPRQKWILLL